MRTLLASILLALLAGCAATQRCPPGEQPAVSEVLYFGTDRPGGAVGADEWDDFLRTSVTPRFPAGFTTWPASGQWRNAHGKIQHEASFVLSVVRPDEAETDRAIRAIAADYKARFRQEAVLRVRGNACSSF